ncbi:alpha/beta fold hydrolase [Comamonas sp. Tr-654]|uniref:alpha/beta fold hydrolase n=1 Tax=Comamonas sp. Tr-654 TaxID=2608341 RepID=UPI00141E46D5|nr:alpha/beta hydrolase [Comamonas sp. Tr-654]
MSFVVSNGRPIYYERAGSGPAVLFLHGAGSNAATWWQQLPAFSERYTCITADIRCFGRSVAPLKEFQWPQLLQDVQRLLEQEKIERVAIVGQSLGGMIGLRLALEHPTLVAGFVASDTSLSIDHPGMLQRIRDRQVTQKAVTVEQRSLGRWFLENEPEKAALYAQINHFNPSTHSLPPEQWGQALADMMKPDALLPMDALAEVKCPTLFVVGSEDPIVPVLAMHEAAELVKGSTVAVIKDAGHSAYFEKPSEYNKLVLGFIGRYVYPQ